MNIWHQPFLNGHHCETTDLFDRWVGMWNYISQLVTQRLIIGFSRNVISFGAKMSKCRVAFRKRSLVIYACLKTIHFLCLERRCCLVDTSGEGGEGWRGWASALKDDTVSTAWPKKNHIFEGGNVSVSEIGRSTSNSPYQMLSTWVVWFIRMRVFRAWSKS